MCSLLCALNPAMAKSTQDGIKREGKGEGGAYEAAYPCQRLLSRQYGSTKTIEQQFYSFSRTFNVIHINKWWSRKYYENIYLSNNQQPVRTCFTDFLFFSCFALIVPWLLTLMFCVGTCTRGKVWWGRCPYMLNAALRNRDLHKQVLGRNHSKTISLGFISSLAHTVSYYIKEQYKMALVSN